jgi:molybdate transport system substrate-binding protein
MRTRVAVVVAALALVVAAALALVVGTAGTADASGPPTVFAAASLTEVLPSIDPSARYSFAGSDTLALQIGQGAPADVFASAAPRYTRKLYRDGLVGKPRFLCFNRLTLIVPTGNPARITSVYDLTRRGIKLVVAGPRVPVGSYTRTVLRNLGISSALGNVVSNETDVKDVVGKVLLGQADAGLVYVTDARAAGSGVERIGVPVFAQPKVRYEIAVVKSTRDAAAARAFVRRVTGPRGRKLLVRAGFRVPAPPRQKR